MFSFLLLFFSVQKHTQTDGTLGTHKTFCYESVSVSISWSIP